MSCTYSQICIVGAGPRGLSVLERLCANERKSPSGDAVTVHVVDPSPPGPGRVWRTEQPRHLLMNTVASQVTVYTDDSVSIDGPLEEGPGLYTWAKFLAAGSLDGPQVPADDETLAEARDLGPDSYPSRALYGNYLQWAFNRAVAEAPAHLDVQLHRARAVALDDEGEPGGPQTLELADGTRLTGLTAVVLALGHVPLRPSARERRLAGYAAAHGLRYYAPANPADVDLGPIAPGETVLLRGLGLNFFDHMALLTVGRGGSFSRDAAGRLVYRPSGTEPRLVAGSRRGVPYHARGDNEKGAHGRHTPRLLTPELIARLRERSARGEWVDFRWDLWPLISREVRAVYYAALLTARGDGTPVDEFTARYLAAAEDPEQERQLLDAADIEPARRWDWDRIAAPYGDREFSGPDDFRAWLLEHLAADVREARLGNVSGPLKAALDVLRDLRNEIRMVVDHGGLEGNSHRDHLEGWYTPLNAFLSIGPPASRIEELAALIEAGVVDVVGPGMEVRAEDDDPGFVVTSTRIPGLHHRATVLIEARLPEPDLRRTADPLLRHLLGTGQCRPYRVRGAGGSEYLTGGLDVTGRPYRVLDARGRAHPRRFAYGVPTESVHWVTAAGIRPGVGSVTLEDSDAIAQAVRALPPTGPTGAGLPGSRAGSTLEGQPA